MAETTEIRELKSTIQIDGNEYAVVAEKAEKVVNQLKILVQHGDDPAAQIVAFDGSELITATINIPTYELTKTDSTITLTRSDGSTSSITDSNTGDMLKTVYDTNNDGKVDSAEHADTAGNAEKLDGYAASEYAKKSDIPEGANLSDYIKKSAITISQEEPAGGVIGDIWFKY